MPKRARELSERRDWYAQKFLKKLSNRLNSEEHVARMHASNRILPVGTLKRGCLRALFGGWAKKQRGCGRLFTKKLASRVCYLLRDRFDMHPESPPDEVTRMHAMMKLARKRQVTVPRKKMDFAETLPLAEAGAKAL